MADAPLDPSGFLGRWALIPESCQYDQGAPPRSGSYEIAQDGETLIFTMRWVDATGTTEEAVISGHPDGRMEPFAGGELADAVSVKLISPRELNSYAFREGKELMVAQRQLDGTGMAMRLVQVVRVAPGESLVNSSVYRRLD